MVSGMRFDLFQDSGDGENWEEEEIGPFSYRSIERPSWRGGMTLAESRPSYFFLPAGFVGSGWRRCSKTAIAAGNKRWRSAIRV